MRTRSSLRDSQIAWNTNDKCDLLAFRDIVSCVVSNEQFHWEQGSDSFKKKTRAISAVELLRLL